MSGLNSENGAGFLKRHYGATSELFQQNLEGKFSKELQKHSKKPNGEGFFTMTYIRGNESGGAFNEDESLNDPQNPEPIQPRILPKNMHWQIQFTGRMDALAESNEGAFVDVFDGNLKDAMERYVSDRNRQYFGNGFGVLTQVNGAVSASTSVVVDSTQYLRINQIIDIFDTIGGTKEVSARKITAIDTTTLTLTLDLAVTCSDNAVIVKQKILDTPGSEGKEITGLAKIIDTMVNGTTFQNISRSTYPEYQSNVLDASSSPISQDLLQQLEDKISIEGGGDPKLIVSRHGVHRNFVNQTITQTQYVNDKLKAGATLVEWNGKRWMREKDCQTNTLYMLDMNPDILGRYVLKDVHLAAKDGKEINKVSGFDKYSAYYVGYENLGSQKPKALGKIINLTEPTS